MQASSTVAPINEHQQSPATSSCISNYWCSAAVPNNNLFLSNRSINLANRTKANFTNLCRTTVHYIRIESRVPLISTLDSIKVTEREACAPMGHQRKERGVARTAKKGRCSETVRVPDIHGEDRLPREGRMRRLSSSLDRSAGLLQPPVQPGRRLITSARL